jgi:hypothetical protein
MTNLEAIKGKVSYPFSNDNTYILALNDQGLTETDTYVVGNKQSLELAQANCIVTLLTTPNVSEGGFSLSQTDKATMIKVASGIFAKYGVANPLKPTATFKHIW